MKTTLFPRAVSLLLVFCMMFTLALGCTGCSGAGGASAASMFLRKTEGTVSVADAGGADVAPTENLGLYSGYTVGTEAASYAWIDLDKVKLTKLDANSAAEITKDGKNLSIEIKSGSMFFNVTEPLAGDETMEITTSSMLVGIRGTCGWVEVPDSGTMRVYLLEGKVECTAGENTATVNAGEMAEMKEDGEVTVKEFTALNVPVFVTEEVEADEALNEAVLAVSGIDVAGNPLSDYAEVFAWLDGEEIIFAEEIDFEVDSSPELLVVNKIANANGYHFLICRRGTNKPESLYSNGLGASSGRSAKLSLVESEGRLFILVHQESDLEDNVFTYFGSTAQNDGDSSCWGQIDELERYNTGDGSFRYHRKSLNEEGVRRGPWEECTIGEYESVIAQYSEVCVIAVAEG